MKTYRIIILTSLILILFSACTETVVVEHVAKSKYDNLQNEFNSLKEKHIQLKTKNNILINKNNELKKEIDAYTKGFSGMYE